MGKTTKARRYRRKVAKVIREKNIATFATKTASRAIKAASENNLTVAVARRGYIYELHPDGRSIRIGILPSKVRVKHSTIRIHA